MTDLLLQRLTAEPVGVSLDSIPWPAGLAPEPVTHQAHPGDPLPKADVLIVTYTTAEAQALADVLTPGVNRTAWMPYTHNWPTFEKELTGRSPAHEAKCMAHYYLALIGSQTVICAKSELHLSTDATTLPLRALFEQMISECRPSLVITTGTAGGIGAGTQLGDVLVTAAAKFNCTKRFQGESWAQQRFQSGFAYDITGLVDDGLLVSEWPRLVAVNAAKLRPSGYADRNPEIMTGDVETVDYFAFADTADSYGVVKNDPQARVEEMDDAVLGLVCETTGQAWCSIRNASDPQMGAGPLPVQKHEAARIYLEYGYYTTIGSALACWAVIAGR